jgi:hypothetical protein
MLCISHSTWKIPKSFSAHLTVSSGQRLCNSEQAEKTTDCIMVSGVAILSLCMSSKLSENYLNYLENKRKGKY